MCLTRDTYLKPDVVGHTRFLLKATRVHDEFHSQINTQIFYEFRGDDDSVAFRIDAVGMSYFSPV